VNVTNTLTNEIERVPIDDHTTIFGLIQAVQKPDPERIAQSGIRIRTAAGSFFCDPTKLCTDYQVGLSIKNVEYGVVSAGEQFVQPKFAPLDKVQTLAAACMSTVANIPTVRQLTLQVVDTQRALQVLKSGGKVSTVEPASLRSGGSASSSSGAGAASVPTSPGRRVEAMSDGSVPKPYKGIPDIQTDLSVQSLIRQFIEVPEAASANGSVVYGTQINVPQGTPAPTDDIMSQTRWLMDVTYLGTWWSNLTPEQRRMPPNLQRGRDLVTRIFEDSSKITKSKRMILMTEAAMSKEQLVALAQCLSDCASH